MTHRTLIGGTAYEIDGGRTLIGGTAYEIDKGKTLVGGTAYEVGFGVPYLANFADNDWETIIAVCRAGICPDEWVVGNQKAMTIGGNNYMIDIIGKNHDNYADGSGKAPFTFQFHDCFGTTYKMNSADTSVGGWGSSELRNTHLPTIKALMPTAIQSAIRLVNKLTTAGSKSAEIVTTQDTLFCLSEVEALGYTSYSGAGEGSQYDYYMRGYSTLKYLSGDAKDWWMRSPAVNYATYFICASRKSNKKFNWATATNSYGVAPAFCF